ncbi:MULTISPECIES: glycerol-3-phosphate dehydrogenase/oxidase [Solibacillus]|uniref:Glycerol-3-phosphate dehydrogenase n=1 Tax=Solibacillus merdavium TaxID=2762218 RepID=A0ABR8XND8_9BACL|nr:glycerol-3-phosphate dehydrogenase/oxidase [Solibacillus merdavium]MBD8033449.1 glycerol-3-phosphate dehydrogenase/oxidase [Solibacillus merdavium]
MGNFSATARERMKKVFQEETFDLFVIGGGITGAGIALDAATRGLKVGLAEMQDFAEGTSSRSTKLVHGGLRYLKQFEIKEVAQLGRERAIVYENGPHVTTPVWMLLPFHKGGTFGTFSTALGLKVYDILASVKKDERRFMLSADETIAREPLIKKDGLVGGGVYVEYRTDDSRLTIEVMKAAAANGAFALNYLKVVGFESNNLAFSTVKVEDQLTGEQYTIKAKKVVNAAGPWVDDVRKLDGEFNNKHLILSKGVHLVFDEDDFPLQQAIYFDTEKDGRMIFAIPRDGKTYVGTTDTFYDGDPKNMDITKEDRQYILDAIHYMFPQLQITEEKIESAWAGVRPLIHEEGKAPSEISRKDEIWQSENGLITIAGGKLTGYRKMAEKIVDLVVSQLNEEYQQSYGKSITKHLPISGGDMSGSKYFERFVSKRTIIGQQFGLTEDQSRYLAKFYGTNVDKVFNYISQAKGDLPPIIYGQLYYAMNEECACTPTDFFIRRTGALLFNIDLVRRYKETVIKEMAEYLNWTENQKMYQKQQLENELKNVTISNK